VRACHSRMKGDMRAWENNQSRSASSITNCKSTCGSSGDDLRRSTHPARPSNPCPNTEITRRPDEPRDDVLPSACSELDPGVVLVTYTAPLRSVSLSPSPSLARAMRALTSSPTGHDLFTGGICTSTSILSSSGRDLRSATHPSLPEKVSPKTRTILTPTEPVCEQQCYECVRA